MGSLALGIRGRKAITSKSQAFVAGTAAKGQRPDARNRHLELQKGSVSNGLRVISGLNGPPTLGEYFGPSSLRLEQRKVDIYAATGPLCASVLDDVCTSEQVRIIEKR